MKKSLVFFLAFFLLVAGCISQPPGQPPPPGKEGLAKELQNVTMLPTEDLIKVSGDENIGVVRISAKNVSGRMLFPMTDYEGQFESAGLYSDAFVVLNKSHIKWLDDDESIWLTVMRGNGSGVLFNAIYSNEKIDCSSGKIRVLGKEYALSVLRHGSSFLRDDKWKIARNPDSACPKRLVIYLDGYFEGLKDNETISLFRNDNTILMKFMDLESEPKVDVIATKPPEQPIQTQHIQEDGTESKTFIVSDQYERKNYTETMTLNSSGLYLYFDPTVNMCGANGCYPSHDDYSPEATEAHKVFLEMPNGEWVISRMRKDSTSEEFNVARETGFAFLLPYSCENKTINSTSGRWEMIDFGVIEGRTKLIMVNVDNGTRITIPPATELQTGDEYIHVWDLFSNYTFCSKGAEVSVFSELLDLAGQDGVMLLWQNETSQNPALKSIFIPHSSPAFENLTEGAG